MYKGKSNCDKKIYRILHKNIKRLHGFKSVHNDNVSSSNTNLYKNILNSRDLELTFFNYRKFEIFEANIKNISLFLICVMAEC